eukprot:1922132-Prorocentrum_lima.AAC.1
MNVVSSQMKQASSSLALALNSKRKVVAHMLAWSSDIMPSGDKPSSRCVHLLRQKVSILMLNSFGQKPSLPRT